MSTAIAVDGVTKQYQIGSAQDGYTTLRETLMNLIAAPARRLRSALRNGYVHESDVATFWALDGVSFEIKKGEVVGLIGRNGAGKSTLLKVLSRITEPTGGSVDVYGRIGSLLEVGTGFHPELTGRENVFLNGALLGMKKAEIERKFDEIVEFSEIGKFLDTPVKRYSSGMYVRLAFSVAAHLNPEVLLVDEVLAVGDLSFQQKCLNKIKSLTTSGMTIFLVSHNMAAIQSSCNRALLLEGGKLIEDGKPARVIEAYRQSLKQSIALSSKSSQPEPASGVTITSFEMFGEDGVSRRDFRFGEKVRIRINVRASRRVESPCIDFGIRRGDGTIVCNFNNWYDDFHIDHIEGECSLEGWLPPLRLIPHYYEIHALVWQRGAQFKEKDITHLKPLAWETFGEFAVEGPPLVEDDGVYQEPALKWELTVGGQRIMYDEMDAHSIYRSLCEEQSEDLEAQVAAC